MDKVKYVEFDVHICCVIMGLSYTFHKNLNEPWKNFFFLGILLCETLSSCIILKIMKHSTYCEYVKYECKVATKSK